MPIYPPRNNPTKKVEILKRRIYNFQKHLSNNADFNKLVSESKKVKTAKLNVLKARLKLSESYNSENKINSDLIEKLKKEMSQWKTFSYDEIKSYCIKVDI